MTTVWLDATHAGACNDRAAKLSQVLGPSVVQASISLYDGTTWLPLQLKDRATDEMHTVIVSARAEPQPGKVVGQDDLVCLDPTYTSTIRSVSPGLEARPISLSDGNTYYIFDDFPRYISVLRELYEPCSNPVWYRMQHLDCRGTKIAGTEKYYRVRPSDDLGMVQGPPVAIASVAGDGLQLQHCSAVARDTREVVLAAVRENGLALEWASPALQDDMDVVIAAVRCDETGDAIDFASGRLQTNERVMETAIASLLRGDPTLETEADVLEATAVLSRGC